MANKGEKPASNPIDIAAVDIAGARTRIQEIAVILRGADMHDPANEALQREAFAILDAFPAQREALYVLACEAILALGRSAVGGANDSTVEPRKEILLGTPGPVFVDWSQITASLGRRPTDAERDAIVLRMDALACGRSVDMTVAACEVFGKGTVSDEVKRILGMGY